MNQVHTTKGLIDRDKLEVKDITQEDSNSRAIATEWFLDGEMVRRDVAVSIFCGQTLASKQEEIR